jgi:hypothetical protein
MYVVMTEMSVELAIETNTYQPNQQPDTEGNGQCIPDVHQIAFAIGSILGLFSVV